MGKWYITAEKEYKDRRIGRYYVIAAYDYADKKAGDIISRHKSYWLAAKKARQSSFWKVVSDEEYYHCPR